MMPRRSVPISRTCPCPKSRHRSLGILVLLGILPFTAGCDSGSDAPPCTVETDETFTFSAPFLDRGGTPIVRFEFQQDVLTYAQGDCTRPGPDVNDVSLVIRNLTACRLQLSYTISLIQGGEGWTYESTATIQPGGAFDQGVIVQGSPFVISNAQALIDAVYEQTNCP